MAELSISEKFEIFNKVLKEEWFSPRAKKIWRDGMNRPSAISEIFKDQITKSKEVE